MLQRILCNLMHHSRLDYRTYTLRFDLSRVNVNTDIAQVSAQLHCDRSDKSFNKPRAFQQAAPPQAASSGPDTSNNRGVIQWNAGHAMRGPAASHSLLARPHPLLMQTHSTLPHNHRQQQLPLPQLPTYAGGLQTTGGGTFSIQGRAGGTAVPQLPALVAGPGRALVGSLVGIQSAYQVPVSSPFSPSALVQG